MCKAISLSILLVFALVLTGTTAFGQTPTGVISGTVTDESGAVIANAAITITNKTTSMVRKINANAAGIFSASVLDSGEYEVRAELPGFRTTVRDATVTAGNTTTVDMAMRIGQSNEVVTVEAAAAQISYESHSVAGNIPRDTIQNLPINGRGFLQLATLEPGVVMVPGSPSQYNGATFTISIGGGISGRTLIALDGTTTWDAIQGGTQMNFSQEIVQEFQLQSVNYDLSTGITSSGAVNVVTRSGGNTQRLFLLPRPQHGRVPRPGASGVQSESVLRAAQSRISGFRPNSQGQALLLLQLRVSEPGAGYHRPARPAGVRPARRGVRQPVCSIDQQHAYRLPALGQT